MGLHSSQRHLNLKVRGLGVSATLGINERSNALIAEGKTVFKMGLGQSPFPVPEKVRASLSENAHQKDYLPVRGLPELRKAVADFHRRTQGIDRSADDVLIGPGSKELMFILQLVYYGDLVIPTPSWVSYAPQAHMLGRNVRWLDTHAENRWALTPEELDKYCAEDPCCPRIIILNYPSNPTGCTYDESELKDLAEVSRKYGLLVLSDEIYSELHYEGAHESIAKYYPEGTIVSSGLSKWAGAGGWRLGTFLFPENLRWLLDAMAVVASETFTSTSAPIQFASISAFEGGPEIKRYLNLSRKVLEALGHHLHRMLEDGGVETPYPEGAFYMFPSFNTFRESLLKRGIIKSSVLCEKILEETGVAMLPGCSFGRPENELTARLAFVNFDGERALAEAQAHKGDLDEAWLKTHCGDAVEAIRRVCDWAKG